MATKTDITTTARTQEDVNNMSRKDRLWDSLNYSYGQKRVESDKAFDNAISQQNRQLLSRGMQRSSYGAQSVANLRQQQVDAQNAIYDQQIADYENRLTDLENTEWEQNFKQAQFDEGVRQFDLNFGFQKERASVSDQQWAQQFAEDVKRNNQNSATNYAMTMLQNGQMPSDEMLASAGLSKADAQRLLSGFNAAKAGSSGGSGGGRGGSGGGGGDDKGGNESIWDRFFALVNSSSTSNTNNTQAKQNPIIAPTKLGTTTSLTEKNLSLSKPRTEKSVALK